MIFLLLFMLQKYNKYLKQTNKMIVKITKWLQFVIFVVVLLFCCLVVLLALMTVRNHKIVQPTKQPNNQTTK